MTVLAAMPKYEEYKDSGVESLGNIPYHWNTHRFKNIFSFGKGLSITKENLQEEGVPCVNYGEIHSKYAFEVDPEIHPLKCVEEKYLESSNKSLLKYGDFVFADTSEDIEGSGNFTYLNSSKAIFAGYHTVIVRPIAGVHIRFLAYILDSSSYRSQIQKKVKGVKVYSITQAILKSTNLWFPSLQEQTAIANFLDKKTAQIDKAIVIKQKQIELLKERKQIIIQKAVTQGLDPDVPMRDSGVDWIGKIPEHWEVKRIKHVATIQNGQIDPKAKEHRGKILIAPNHIESGSGRIIYKETALEQGAESGKYPVKSGSLLYSKIRPELRKTCIAENDGMCSADMYSINTNSSVSAKYLLLIFLGEQFNGFMVNQSMRVAMPKVNRNDVSNYWLAVPPIAEQEELVSFIDKISFKIDSSIHIAKLQIENLKEYKATLINSAVTGKIKVPISNQEG